MWHASGTLATASPISGAGTCTGAAGRGQSPGPGDRRGRPPPPQLLQQRLPRAGGGSARARRALRRPPARWGVGAGASHLVCGHTSAHQRAGGRAARHSRAGRARCCFGSGYAANMGTIGALLGPGDRVFEDRLNHASLLDGGWISRADFTWYRHRDVDGPRREAGRCQRPTRRRRTLIVSDGTFSMDGDLCPLPELVALAREHGAWLMIDDAHGFGVHGRGGRGLVDRGALHDGRRAGAGRHARQGVRHLRRVRRRRGGPDRAPDPAGAQLHLHHGDAGGDRRGDAREPGASSRRRSGAASGCATWWRASAPARHASWARSSALADADPADHPRRPGPRGRRQRGAGGGGVCS